MPNIYIKFSSRAMKLDFRFSIKLLTPVSVKHLNPYVREIVWKPYNVLSFSAVATTTSLKIFGECLPGISYTCELLLTETLLFTNTFQSKTSSFLVSASQNIADGKIHIKRTQIQLCQDDEFQTWHSSVFPSSNIYSETAFEIYFVSS